MQYRYNNHIVDVFCTLAGYVGYLDNDLEPQDLSEDEYVDIVTNGVLI